MKRNVKEARSAQNRSWQAEGPRATESAYEGREFLRKYADTFRALAK
jgi:hypothetical protein